MVEDSRHGIMIRCKDAAREREKINATGIEVGFLNGRIPKETLKDGTFCGGSPVPRLLLCSGRRALRKLEWM